MLLKFDREVKNELIEDLDHYLREELDVELGTFDVEFLIDHLSATLGPRFYNQAIKDVQSQMAIHLESINERIDELIQPVERTSAS